MQVLGASGVPQAGDTFQVMVPEKAAEIAITRRRLEREKQMRVKERGMKLGDFSRLVAKGEAAGVLPLIIKGDVDGSVQAVADALEQLGTTEVGSTSFIGRSEPSMNRMCCSPRRPERSSWASVVRPDAKSRQLADRDGVEIKLYEVIYNAWTTCVPPSRGMLSPSRGDDSGERRGA